MTRRYYAAYYRQVTKIAVRVLIRSLLDLETSNRSPPSRSWYPGPRVIITSVSGRTITQVPVSFLRSCDHDIWRYIRHVVMLLVEQGVKYPGHLYDLECQAVGIDGVSLGGTFRYLQQGVSINLATFKGFSSLYKNTSGERTARSDSRPVRPTTPPSTPPREMSA
jgi:hypothetical protein